MKLGVFSDIHGNIYAFKKVWRALKNESCDMYLFAGDICGYYYFADDIIDVFLGIPNLIAVRGNHDEIFLELFENNGNYKMYEQKYGKALTELKQKIKFSSTAYLRKLPKKIEIEDLGLMVHGSPWNNLEEYVYPWDDFSNFSNINKKLIVLGHTHYPMVKKIGTTTVVNPGSCGQPRDIPAPSYSIIDSRNLKCVIKRVEYDVRPLIKDIKRRNETNPYLIDILLRWKINEKK